MLSALTLPLVAVLLALPGIPHIPGLPNFGMKDLNRLRHKTAAPLDSLPPAWKPASLLALEDQFVRAALPDLAPEPVGMTINQDPRQLRVSFDPDSSMVLYSTQVGDFTVGEVTRMPIADYSNDLSRRTFQRLWAEKTRQGLTAGPVQAAGAAPRSGGLVFDLPSPLPKRIQSLLGPGGPSLSVSGSENIRLSGTSNWTNQQTTALGQSRSLFPSLDMQQDLNIRLEGRLSDRVGVNLLQNSANQIPLENKVAINYKGDEDDLIQALDLGNTNLTLPGTQYVSYSGKNEGLFGMKATTRLGPLDFTVLASKQEGRSERAGYQGGSSRQTQVIYDKDYVKGVYFFLYDPNLPQRAIDERTISLYQDEGVYTTTTNVTRGRAYVDPDSSKICFTVGQPLPGGATCTDTTRYTSGSFHKLLANQDYDILGDLYGPSFKVIRLRTALSSDAQQLAVTYRYRAVDANGSAVGDSIHVGGQIIDDYDGNPTTLMQLLRPKYLGTVMPLRPDGTFETDPAISPFAVARDLELKNFYQLAGQGIDKATFVLTIRQGDAVPAKTSVIEGPADASYSVPYMEMLGLDDQDESKGSPIRGHDGFVDGTRLSANFGVWVDWARGTLFLPDPRPFAPRFTDPTKYPFEKAVSDLLLRRDALVGPPPALGADPDSNASNPAIYDKGNVQPTDRLYAFEIQFTASTAGNEIMLGRTNIIQGSDVVKINGAELVRDKDYRIDYDLGRVTLIKQMGGSDQLSIDYSYAPLFQQAAKTLIGNAFRWEGKQQSFGGAFMYESSGAQDLRPRLGEEPSRVLIGDLNTEWHFRPSWVTRAVNGLPGVRTTAPSELNIQAEVGASSPNPNTSNQVYIDDMEGVRDAVTVSMGPERWRWSSVPLDSVTKKPVSDPVAVDQLKNAEIHWYAPLNVVKERDLKPSLDNAQGAQNPHQVLAVSLPRRPADAPEPQKLWAGLTYPLDRVGLDLTHSQFIEIWIDDFRDFHDYTLDHPVPRVRGRNVKLHIDLGIVSEDEQRAPNILPNDSLDTEDKAPYDGQLVVTDESSNNEDTGLDGQLNGAETQVPNNNLAAPAFVYPDLATVTPTDLSGDDFAQPNSGPSGQTNFKDWDPRKWLYTNGTEGDKNVVPVPEGEDLNGNNLIDDKQNDYFEYTIDLGDSTQRYLATDVFKTYQGPGGAPGHYQNNGEAIPLENGWRRYRIPIADSLRTKFGSPDLSHVQHVRVWLEDIQETDSPDPPGLDRRPFIALGGLEIVGSRWIANDLDSTAVKAGTTLTINSVNTIDNADIYQPPFDPGQTRNGNQEVTRREQSLALEFTSLPPRDTVQIYKTFSLDEDYSRYGKLNFFAAGFNLQNYNPVTDSLFFFVRFASDERGTSYYEYRAPVPTVPQLGVNWRQILLTLTDLSNLKLQPDFPKAPPILYRAPGKLPGEEYVIRGQPSFTRLRRISFGIMNESSGRTFSNGQVWLDEMRATNVARDAGSAQRVLVNGSFSNLMRYNLVWSGNDADFQSVGQSRGSGNKQSQVQFQTGIDLNRFFESTRIIMPVNFSYNGSQSEPRFTAGDDVVRTGALAEASDSRSTGRTISTSYSRTWSDRSNPFLRYTVGGITANYSRTDIDNRNPISIDQLLTTNAAVNYSLAPRQWLKIPLGRKLTFFPLPERFTWNYSVMNATSNSVQRSLDSSGVHVPIYGTTGHQANVLFGADTRPFDFFHHSFAATRNLALDPSLMERVGFINLGKVVGWNQQMDARLQPQRYGAWLRPNFTWNSRYGQANGPELSSDLSVRQITNNQSIGATWDLPFDQLTVAGGAPRDTSHRGVAGWKRFLSRLGPVGSDAQFNSSSAYSRTIGTADFLYMMGLRQNPGFGPADSTGKVQQSFGNQSVGGTDWRFGAHTTFLLLYNATVLVRSDYSRASRGQNGVTTRSNRVHFPTLELNYGRLPEVLGLKRFLVNPTIKTSYDRNQSVDYSNSETPTGVQTSSEWRPLFDVSGDLKNGTRCQLRVERRVTASENRVSGNSTTIQRNTTVNLSVNRSYSKGQKVNILGKESTVRSNINVGMTTAYERQSGGTFAAGFSSLPQDIDRLSVNANGGYSFSSNVTGNLELGFGQNRNLLLKTVNRSVRVELRAQFTF